MLVKYPVLLLVFAPLLKNPFLFLPLLNLNAEEKKLLLELNNLDKCSTCGNKANLLTFNLFSCCCLKSKIKKSIYTENMLAKNGYVKRSIQKKNFSFPIISQLSLHMNSNSSSQFNFLYDASNFYKPGPTYLIKK